MWVAVHRPPPAEKNPAMADPGAMPDPSLPCSSGACGAFTPAFTACSPCHPSGLDGSSPKLTHGKSNLPTPLVCGGDLPKAVGEDLLCRQKRSCSTWRRED